MANKPLVIDIYHGDPVNSFHAVKDAGIVGVIHKSSQGRSIVDHTYASRRKLAVAAGLAWGAYHFMEPGSAKNQAEFFLSVASPDAATLVALDWETGKSGSPSAADARIFLQTILDHLGRHAVVYSGNVAKERITGADAFFGAHRLWLAQYGTKWSVQKSWKKPWLWQNNGDSYGPGPHHIPGISGLCDNNTVLSGTAADLLKTWAI